MAFISDGISIGAIVLFALFSSARVRVPAHYFLKGACAQFRSGRTVPKKFSNFRTNYNIYFVVCGQDVLRSPPCTHLHVCILVVWRAPFLFSRSASPMTLPVHIRGSKAGKRKLFSSAVRKRWVCVCVWVYVSFTHSLPSDPCHPLPLDDSMQFHTALNLLFRKFYNR